MQELPALKTPPFLDFTDLERWFNKEIVPLYGAKIDSLVVYRKVGEEFGEWLQDANIEEALDVIATLWLWIRLECPDVEDVNAVLEQKVFKLFAREWEKLDDERWHHKKTSPILGGSSG